MILRARASVRSAAARAAGLAFLGEEKGKRVSVERAEELVATGASVVGAACPFCNTMFRDALAGVSKTPPKLHGYRADRRGGFGSECRNT